MKHTLGYDTSRCSGRYDFEPVGGWCPERDDGTKVLTSYDNHVAEIKGGKLSVFGWYSATTARHINEFAVQNGFPKMTKKEMEEYPL